MSNPYVQGLQWLRNYFEKNKSFLEILAIFITALAFLYSQMPEKLAPMVTAVQIVFWIFSIIIIYLLFVSADEEISFQEDRIFQPLTPTVFFKYLIRGLLLTLFTSCLIMLYHIIKDNWGNIYVNYLYGVVVFSLLGDILVRAYRRIKHLKKPRNNNF